MKSHLQTRAVRDALDQFASVLLARGTELAPRPELNELGRLFSKNAPEFSRGWAFVAAEFDEALREIRTIAPQLANSLTVPMDPNEFIVVGHCSIQAPFRADKTRQMRVTLRNGKAVLGAEVVNGSIRQFSNGAIGIPVRSGATVYIRQLEPTMAAPAARLALDTFLSLGEAHPDEVTICFPIARATTVPPYDWVSGLRSVCGVYTVKDLLSDGNAFIDANGFFAEETQIITTTVVGVRSPKRQARRIVVDGPFVAFLADISGIHAAAWFDVESFSPARDDARH